jgi:hypothetical protein
VEQDTETLVVLEIQIPTDLAAAEEAQEQQVEVLHLA